MDENQTGAIDVGRITLTKRGDVLEIKHTSKAGVVQIEVDADKLERWAMRLLRDEAFAPERVAA